MHVDTAGQDGKSSASSEMLHHEGLQRTNPIGKTPFAEEHGSETHEYLVQLAWQQFVLTEGQC